MSFYGRPGDGIEITSTDDARRLRSIGVTREFAVDQELTRLGFTNLDRVERPGQMIEKLLAGRNEVFASDDGFVSPSVLEQLKVSADAIVRKYKFKTTKTYIAFSLGTPPETVRAWQRALDEMRADGTFARLSAGID
jgi:polar amino acid transport system substrate-binding protein